MKKTWKKLDLEQKKLFIYIILSTFLIAFFLSSFLQDILLKFVFGLMPFFIGLFLAAILHPLVVRVEKKTKWSRKRASILTFLFVQFLIILGILILWNPISEDFFFFLERINSVQFLVSLGEQLDSLLGIENGYQVMLETKTGIVAYLNDNWSKILISFGGTLASLLLLLMAAFAIAVYILIDYPRYLKYINLMIGKKTKFATFNKAWQKGFRAWVKGWSIDQSFIFVFTGILLFFFGVESWITLTIIMTLFNFVPFIGPIIGGALVSVFVLAMYVGTGTVAGPLGIYYLPSIVVVLGVFIGVSIIQTVESIYVVPHVYSQVASINPVAILTGLSVIGLILSPYLTPLTIPILIFIKIFFTSFFGPSITAINKKNQ